MPKRNMRNTLTPMQIAQRKLAAKASAEKRRRSKIAPRGKLRTQTAKSNLVGKTGAGSANPTGPGAFTRPKGREGQLARKEAGARRRTEVAQKKMHKAIDKAGIKGPIAHATPAQRKAAGPAARHAVTRQNRYFKASDQRKAYKKKKGR
jgi:hypothetical protein